MYNGRNVMSFADKLETYRISWNHSRGDYFFLRAERGQLFEGRDYFKSVLLTGIQINWTWAFYVFQI